MKISSLTHKNNEIKSLTFLYQKTPSENIIMNDLKKFNNKFKNKNNGKF